jgi:hypothetical protein
MPLFAPHHHFTGEVMTTTLTRRSLFAGGLAVASIGGLAACGDQGGTGTTEPVDALPTSFETEQTIDVFSGLSNQMGDQPGWFGKLVDDNFKLTLNIIAPNVAGGGDTLYNTRVSAGDLGDYVLTDVGRKLDELVDGGLLTDFSSLYEVMPNAQRFDAAVQHINEGKDGIYALPTQVSSLKPSQPSEGIEPTFGPYLRWDLYKEIGYPEIGTLEDLLPVLEDMQKAQPTAPNGKKVYALSLFKDWDGNMMNNAKQPACYYGYDEIGFVYAKADGSDYQSILDSDSLYVRNLKFFFEANQRGLVDPDSTTQNYDTLYSKFQAGQVLFSFWPWQGKSAYNTEDNMAEGKGFMLAPLQDMKVFSYGLRREPGGLHRLSGRGAGADRRLHRLAVLLRGGLRQQRADAGWRWTSGPHLGTQRRQEARAHRVRSQGAAGRRCRDARGLGRRHLPGRHLLAEHHLRPACRRGPGDRVPLQLPDVGDLPGRDREPADRGLGPEDGRGGDRHGIPERP